MEGTGSLTFFTNDRGGAIDDSVVTRSPTTRVYLVVNTSCCRDKMPGAMAFREVEETHAMGAQVPLPSSVLSGAVEFGEVKDIGVMATAAAAVPLAFSSYCVVCPDWTCPSC